jgi:hypothetical protein|nr:MAG TPA: hypothetical protein [Bacteriophage sp.]
MRVISQDGTLDFPYELSTIRVYNEIISMGMCKDDSCRSIIARYSTEEKAIKAMEILREQYSRIEIIKALASGTCKHMEESLKPEEFKDILKKYINMEVFQFPQDDEIEV